MRHEFHEVARILGRRTVSARLIASLGLVAVLAAPVSADDVPAIRLSVRGIVNSGIAFEVENSGVLNYAIQTTTNLVNWNPALHVFARGTPINVFYPFLAADTNVVNHSSFYRGGNEAQYPTEMKAQWRERGLTNYTFRFTKSYFTSTPVMLSGLVTVSNGAVVKVEDVRNFSTPLENVDTSEFKSIEQLFDIVEEERGNADITAVRLDPVGGFPLWIYLDRVREMADDEVSFFVGEVRRN